MTQLIFCTRMNFSQDNRAHRLLLPQQGAAFACMVAKEMVVYMRRDGAEAQNSIYLQSRQHINHHMHRVQDHITRHLRNKLIIEELAALVFISPRNFTRLFKSTTGITIGQYIQSLRQEKAKHLLKTKHKVAGVAKECGFSSAARLRKLVKEAQD